MNTLTSTEQEILDKLAEGLHQRLGGFDGRLDTSWVAAAMLDAIPATHPFAELGPFYDTTAVARWLGISRQALHQKVKASRLLALATGDSQRVYPAWQFLPDGRPLTGLADLLRVLNPAAADSWTVAVWLTAPVEELGEHSAVDVMRSLKPVGPRGKQWEHLIAEAREDAARWSQ